MRSNSIDIYHVVNAAEAAYPSLLGHYTQGTEEWVNSALPIHPNLWPIILRSAYIEIIRGGLHVDGVHAEVYGLLSNVRPFSLVSGVQGIIHRITWYGELPTRYGFGVLFRLGALLDADEIRGGVIYEYE
jgi:hypothetical protein